MAEIDKEAFVAAVVHDMRAPLNACLMSLSLIELKASQPAEVLKSVEVIRRNLERQALLIDDLGDALEMVGAGLELEIEPADLVEIAEKAAKTIESLSADVDIGWAGPRPDARLLRADPERLGRAIGTLLEIIAAAGPPDRIELRVSEESGQVRLEMRRTAAQAADASPRRKRPVMRLTVASEIVEKHGGRMEVDDARAAVELPLR